MDDPFSVCRFRDISLGGVHAANFRSSSCFLTSLDRSKKEIFLPARYDIASGFFRTRLPSDVGMTCVLHFYHMMSPLLCELAQRQEAEFAQNKAHQVMKTQKTSHSHFRQ